MLAARDGNLQKDLSVEVAPWGRLLWVQGGGCECDVLHVFI
jgi:hypothetical protein